jgi:membrane protease YdiL (CAAX protease family)
MNRLANALRGYFGNLEQKNKWPFFWRAWLHAVVVAYAVGNLAHLMFPAGRREDLASKSAFDLCLLVLVIGPVVETVFFQFLPLEFTRAANARRWIRIGVSVIPFALMHHFAGVPTVVAAGFVGGVFFAFTYERWRSESIVVALLMTFLLHSSFNLVGVVAMLLLR